MDNSFYAIPLFLIITLFYFWKLKSNHKFTILYVGIVIISQFILNTSLLIAKCNGNINANIFISFIVTFFPWIFIFGSVVLFLIALPEYKSAFANVIGYFIVANRAHSLLSELLLARDPSTGLPIAGEVTDTEVQKEFQKVASTILKICGDMSVLINQITPINFESYWSTLLPLMKPQYQTDMIMKQNLLDIVIQRDDIGEAVWYIYTGILIISITQYNLTLRGCQPSMESIEETKRNYLENKIEPEEEDVVYTND